MTRPMMACGHTAQGTIGATGAPVCAICAPSPESRMVVVAPDVSDRLMRCSYANRPSERDEHRGGGQYAAKTYPSTHPSNPQAAFFKSRPDEAEDQFYCGCWGWD